MSFIYKPLFVKVLRRINNPLPTPEKRGSQPVPFVKLYLLGQNIAFQYLFTIILVKEKIMQITILRRRLLTIPGRISASFNNPRTRFVISAISSFSPAELCGRVNVSGFTLNCSNNSSGIYTRFRIFASYFKSWMWLTICKAAQSAFEGR